MFRCDTDPDAWDDTPDTFPVSWFERHQTSLHYIDNGWGRPVLFVHGRPAWPPSLPQLIKSVTQPCRFIAPAYPGLDFSSNTSELPRFSPMEQAQWIGALMDHLNLDAVILVLQDWGGPIGLSIATARPEKIAGLVLHNTWCWPSFAPARMFSWLKRWSIGNRLRRQTTETQNRGAAPRLSHMTNRSICEGSTHSPGLKRLVFSGTSQWLKETERRLEKLSHLPVSMAWDMEDPSFGRESQIRKWLYHFPHAAVDRICKPGGAVASHHPDRIAAAVSRILELTPFPEAYPGSCRPSEKRTIQSTPSREAPGIRNFRP